MDTVGYHYNLHVNFDSFLYTIATVKKHSPGSPIHLVTDRSLNQWKEYKIFSTLCDIPFFTLRDKESTFIDRNDPDNDRKESMVKEFLDRMYLTCTLLEVDWVVRLEDDVHMRWPIKEFPTTPAAGNHSQYGMGGGSIFKREVFMDMYSNLPDGYLGRLIQENADYSYSIDGLLKTMFTRHEYKYTKWCEITEDHLEEDKLTAAFHHGDKSLYNKDYLEFRGLV